MSDFSRIGMVGAGFMGSGIAESAAAAGVAATVFEPEQAPLDRSRARSNLGRPGGVARQDDPPSRASH